MELSIIIPSRNEMFLRETILDIVKNREAETEVIALLDGEEANPLVPQLPNVNLIYVNKSIGQRAGANVAARLATGKYIMKCDAHCSFDKGFDRKMLDFFKEVGDNVTAVPTMRNLWAFDWKCTKCGKKWYQDISPTKCKETDFKGTGKPCEGVKFIRKIMWVGKERPQSNSFCFDSTPHFQYFGSYLKRPEVKKMVEEKGYNETMSLQGSCFMSTREKYWEWDLGGEELGNWGNQGMQIACATWLSGGKVLVNHKTWYAHMFRTKGGDFGFPYQLGGKETQRTKDNVKNLFWNKKHSKQIYPVSWLLEKFWPVDKWTDEDLAKLKEHEANLPS